MINSFKQFITLRAVGAIVVGVIVIWGCWMLLDFFQGPDEPHVAEIEESEPLHSAEGGDISLHGVEETHPGVQPPTLGPSEPQAGGPTDHGLPAEHRTVSEDHGVPAEHGVPAGHGVAGEHGAPEHGALHEERAKGVAFVEATMSTLDYELNERFWGWRRNDIVRLTDNVENMQLGVLEVVRRTTVILADRTSRYGVTDAIDPNLESAMNWLMIKPDRYWLPAAEEKYNDSLKELREYAQRLERGEARFYIRADSLIPLLVSLSDLVGSCDENLVRSKEEDGSPVSWFKVDDYFYYAKGVAKALGEILHAVREDFSEVLEARHGVDLLHHAVHACHVASELDPWLVTDASLDGILANHRANMAAPISHVRHYLDALAKALST
ncbi:MAG: DUF2333 family protein [Thermodesulfobacteriota bacterium]|nr:DUF2333 family protein [Thermodesulfobacteriota bacterium]